MLYMGDTNNLFFNELIPNYHLQYVQINAIVNLVCIICSKQYFRNIIFTISICCGLAASSDSKDVNPALTKAWDNEGPVAKDS